MEIIVNGEKEYVEEMTILDYLNQKRFNKKGLIIEYNYKIIKENEWGEIYLNDGDNLEILSFVGGG